MTTVPGGWLSADVEIYKSYDAVRKMMAFNVGGEGTLWKFAFSMSYSYQKMQNVITNSSKYISDTSSFESATRVDLNPGWVLEMDKYAKLYINSTITGTIESDESAYNKFIEEFGTHYFATGNFGGYIRLLTETEISFFDNLTETDAQRSIKASFQNSISFKIGTEKKTSSVSQSFEDLSKKTIKYYGGDTNLLRASSVDEWQPTVDKDPWLYSGQLKPISDLITDETKKASMEKAVENHVTKNYLYELERLISTARAKSDDVVIGELQAKVNDLRKVKLLGEKEVDRLKEEIEDEFLVPAWFSNNVNFCFKWRADGDRGQCGDNVANLLCAKVNSKTQAYKDNTDKRAGGCQLQWGIQATGHRPAWFNDVKVCYKWSAGDDAGQCGGGADKLLCAGVNEYTPAYRDDTDGRQGGCQMSWMLQVPDKAPLWIRTTKVCLSWYPDGDSGQCSPHSPRDLCAAANNWTEFYLDNTDNRGGGCRMSWGLISVF